MNIFIIKKNFVFKLKDCIFSLIFNLFPSHKEPVNSIGILLNKFTINKPSCLSFHLFPGSGQFISSKSTLVPLAIPKSPLIKIFSNNLV